MENFNDNATFLTKSKLPLCYFSVRLFSVKRLPLTRIRNYAGMLDVNQIENNKYREPTIQICFGYYNVCFTMHLCISEAG